MDTSANMLIALAREVRGRTLAILQKAQGEWLTWTPAGTSNHMLWHAGHGLWVQDAPLTIVPLTGKSELPGGWAGRFGMESHPEKDAGPWPLRAQMVELLEGQLVRMEEVITGAEAAKLGDMTPDPGERGVGWGILHGLHDEAIHQGEMYLLQKLCRNELATNEH